MIVASRGCRVLYALPLNGEGRHVFLVHHPFLPPPLFRLLPLSALPRNSPRTPVESFPGLAVWPIMVFFAIWQEPSPCAPPGVIHFIGTGHGPLSCYC
jgi:hypothetical protein